MSEEEFLQNYHIEDFERPSLATDIVVFSVMAKREEQDAVRDPNNFRKMPQKKWKILLIRRENHPFQNHWALPGGFCQKEEDVLETAKRELFEETNVRHARWIPVGVFGEKDRDPRGWIISNSYLALVDGEKAILRAGTDAWEAKWFTIELIQGDLVQQNNGEVITQLMEYQLRLIDEEAEDGTILYARIREKKEFSHLHLTVSYEVLENQKLAFDHAKIILSTALRFRKMIRDEDTLIFDLLPEAFTFAQLQNAYEIVLGEPQLVANFRRKMKDYCVETEGLTEGAGHRPAKLFVRNLKKLL